MERTPQHKEKGGKGAPGRRCPSEAERKADERSVGCAIARRATPGLTSQLLVGLKGVTLNAASRATGGDGYSRLDGRRNDPLVTVRSEERRVGKECMSGS